MVRVLFERRIPPKIRRVNYDNLTLGRACRTDAFPHAVAGYLRTEAAAARVANPGFHQSGRHAGTLENLADYIVGIGHFDQRLRALELSTPGSFEPGPQTRRYIALLATDGRPAVDSGEALHELVAVAVEDLIARHADEVTAFREQVRSGGLAASDAERLREHAAEREAEAERVINQLAERERELREANTALAFFRRLNGTDETSRPEPPPAPGAKPDRVRVDGQPNLYRRGERYDIAARKEGGGTRWVNAGTDLEKAIAKRDAMIESGEVRSRQAVAA